MAINLFVTRANKLYQVHLVQRAREFILNT